MAADVEAVFLNTDEFAEWVVVRAPEGAPRRIKADCQERQGGQLGERQNHQTLMRSLDVFVVRNATTGIATYADGMTLVREDEPSIVWKFAGVLESESDSWTLLFETEDVTRRGFKAGRQY